MTDESVKNLEIQIVNRGYKITKKYDQDKGICTVTATRDDTGATITAKNTSRSSLWTAYRTALNFVESELKEYERITGKGF